MSQLGLEVLDSTLQKTHLWLHDLQQIGHFPDQGVALKALRAVLHALRDRLSVDVAAHFGAQLPVLVRGFFYEGWHPAGKPLLIRSQQTFLDQIKDQFIAAGLSDPRRIAHTVFELLNRHLSRGEPAKVRQTLPKETQELWQEPSPAFR